MSAVLLLRRGGLGDTLLMLPLLRALRRAHPGAALHFAGVREFAELFVTHRIVDAVHSSEDLRLWDLTAARERLRAYDLIVGDEPGLATIALDVRRIEPGVPIARQWLRQAGLDGAWPDDAWLLPPRVHSGGAVMLAPGSGGRAKCWPRERWLELAAMLVPHAPIHVVVGPVEQERDDPRSWPWPGEVAFVVEAEVTRLATRIEAAACFVGNDSGPTHLAAMLGVPTVAVFGATDPMVWAPVGPHVLVVGGDGRAMPAIAATEVWAAMRDGLLEPQRGNRSRTRFQ